MKPGLLCLVMGVSVFLRQSLTTSAPQVSPERMQQQQQLYHAIKAGRPHATAHAASVTLQINVLHNLTAEQADRA